MYFTKLQLNCAKTESVIFLTQKKEGKFMQVCCGLQRKGTKKIILCVGLLSVF